MPYVHAGNHHRRKFSQKVVLGNETTNEKKASQPSSKVQCGKMPFACAKAHTYEVPVISSQQGQ